MIIGSYMNTLWCEQQLLPPLRCVLPWSPPECNKACLHCNDR